QPDRVPHVAAPDESPVARTWFETFNSNVALLNGHDCPHGPTATDTFPRFRSCRGRAASRIRQPRIRIARTSFSHVRQPTAADDRDGPRDERDDRRGLGRTWRIRRVVPDGYRPEDAAM